MILSLVLLNCLTQKMSDIQIDTATFLTRTRSTEKMFVKNVIVPTPSGNFIGFVVARSTSPFILSIFIFRSNKFEEFFTMNNYCGVLCDVAVSTSYPLKIFLLNEQHHLSCVGVDDDESKELPNRCFAVSIQPEVPGLESFKVFNNFLLFGFKQGVRLYSLEDDSCDTSTQSAVETTSDSSFTIKETIKKFRNIQHLFDCTGDVCGVDSVALDSHYLIYPTNESSVLEDVVSSSVLSMFMNYTKGYLEIFDITRKQVVCRFTASAYAPIKIVSLSPSGNFLAVADQYGKSVRVFRVHHKTEKAISLIHVVDRGNTQTNIRQLLFSREDDILVLLSQQSVRFILIDRTKTTNYSTLCDGESICKFSPATKVQRVAQLDKGETQNPSFALFGEDGYVTIVQLIINDGKIKSKSQVTEQHLVFSLINSEQRVSLLNISQTQDLDLQQAFDWFYRSSSKYAYAQ
ncbi:hypothetical protein EIN_131870 [Entamoeba invadens IP1]|uniref:WD repeat domain phosphoinositide-interacting protein n=1 Tax=Entamoeba invadens IP1 TaxID=370355 RepID=A0A0A1UGZ8_ENTIV|nr:hypothetical protein EIN_131870 [Entamoeba invadens IP1]ELP94338.1 hypothetical protein EIN_131870 [Entamoeba invadens IP1]|eukprot:XP_004261109.1 hypothetical protein EIN_131870 [Entamoeba invadens IP1]